MQVSAVLFIEWLKRMDSTQRILNIWLQNAENRLTDIESDDYYHNDDYYNDDYYNGTLVWDIPVTETKQIDDPIKSMSKQMYQHLMEVSPNIIFDNTRPGVLEWDEFEYADIKPFKHSPLIKPTPKYKVLDFDDNILGEAFTMEEALDIFYTRYAVFDKKAALEFIETI